MIFFLSYESNFLLASEIAVMIQQRCAEQTAAPAGSPKNG
jgi:hypothetical protein